MMQIGLVGIGAGVASGLLFASVASGSLLSVVLFYLAPLPMMIAALGWSHWSALIGAFIGALALSAMFGSVFFFAFLASAGLPAWWLGYLAMLARPAPAGGGNGEAPALEWYPPGRLVMWAALIAVLVVVVAIANFGLDADSFRNGLHHALAQLLQAETGGVSDEQMKEPGIANTKLLFNFLVAARPPAAVVLATVTNVLNLWLAGRVVKFSGRLSRPWPELSAMRFPRPLVGALALAVALSFVGGIVGIIAGVLAAGLTMAFGLLGLAVLHAITQGVSARAFMLGGVYAALLVFGWPVLVLSLLGLTETTIDLRSRIAHMRAPPAGGG